MCVLEIANTGNWVIVVGLLDEGVLLAPPPDTLAVFVKEALAVAETSTPKVIALPAVLAGITVLLVQVTS